MTGERKGKDAARQKPAVDHDLIRELALLLDETGLGEIEYGRAGQRVRVARQTHLAAAVPTRTAAPAEPPAPAAETAPLDPAKHPGVITSPMVGTAYVGPEP